MPPAGADGGITNSRPIPQPRVSRFTPPAIYLEGPEAPAGSADRSPAKLFANRSDRDAEKSLVIPGRPDRACPWLEQGAGPGTQEHTGQVIDFRGPCSWVPGSWAKPAPRNDRHAAFFSALLDRGLDIDHLQ